ncbi:MAG: hypothetical protein BJ554DRAFT_4238, partial [Olpidium bornovanus]
ARRIVWLVGSSHQSSYNLPPNPQTGAIHPFPFCLPRFSEATGLGLGTRVLLPRPRSSSFSSDPFTIDARRYRGPGFCITLAADINLSHEEREKERMSAAHL